MPRMATLELPRLGVESWGAPLVNNTLCSRTGIVKPEGRRQNWLVLPERLRIPRRMKTHHTAKLFTFNAFEELRRRLGVRFWADAEPILHHRCYVSQMQDHPCPFATDNCLLRKIFPEYIMCFAYSKKTHRYSHFTVVGIYIYHHYNLKSIPCIYKPGAFF